MIIHNIMKISFLRSLKRYIFKRSDQRYLTVNKNDIWSSINSYHIQNTWNHCQRMFTFFSSKYFFKILSLNQNDHETKLCWCFSKIRNFLYQFWKSFILEKMKFFSLNYCANNDSYWTTRVSSVIIKRISWITMSIDDPVWKQWCDGL